MINKLIGKAKALFARMIARFGRLHVFAANEDGMAEYVVAHSKQEAYAFLVNIWGTSCMEEYVNEFRQEALCENEADLMDAFIDSFIRQLPDKQCFTVYDECENGQITKTAKQWADEAGCVCWLCGEP